MTLLHDKVGIGDPAPPGAEVLIEEARQRQRRRQRGAVAAVLLAALAGLAAAYGAGGFSGAGRTRAGRGSPGSAGPSSGRPSSAGAVAIEVPGLVGTRDEPPVSIVVAFGDGSTWVLGESGVVRLSAATGRMEAAVPVRGDAEGLAFGDGELWVESVVLGTRGYLLSEIDPSTDRLVRRVVVDGGPHGHLQQGVAGSYQTLVAEGPYLYLNTHPSLFALDAATGKVVPVHIAVKRPVFELVNGKGETMPTTGAFGALDHGDVTSSTVLDGHVWATRIWSSRDGQWGFKLDEYDARSGAELRVSTAGVWLVASGGGELWGIEQHTAAPARQTLVELDSTTGRVERRLPLPASADSPNAMLSVGEGAVWVIEPTAKTVYRVAL